MRIGDLCRSEVLDADGERIGRVHDVLLVQDGPMLGQVRQAFRVAGLVAGGSGLAVRLGYGRRGLKGPWLLRIAATALERRARFIEWDQVARWDGSTVRLSVQADALGPLPD